MRISWIAGALCGVLALPATQSALAELNWYSCTVKANSHTGRYTFRIETSPCRIYWREIDTQLKIRDCELPEIAALKPSATDNHSVVWFNLQTGEFYDYLSGVLDRGKCTKLVDMKINPAPVP